MRGKHALSAALIAALLLAAATASGQEATPPSSAQSTPAVGRIRIGGNVQQAKITHQVVPVYPEIAKRAHISGTVVLRAIIAKDGSVQQLQYLSGPPLLMRAAMDAIRQWKYEPTLLQGQPVEVDTTISVIFTLGESTQAPASPASPDIDPQLKVDILHLMEVTHSIDRARSSARAMFDSLRPQLIASFPATPNREKIVTAYEQKLTDLFDTQEFKDAIVALYAKYFTQDDVKALIQFYESPAGQHYNEVAPQIMSESVSFGQNLAAKNLSRIFGELCKEYPELQGEAKFCTASPEKKSLLLSPDDPPFVSPTALP